MITLVSRVHSTWSNQGSVMCLLSILNQKKLHCGNMYPSIYFIFQLELWILISALSVNGNIYLYWNYSDDLTLVSGSYWYSSNMCRIKNQKKIWRASWNLYSTPVLVVYSLNGGNILEEIWTQRRSSPEPKPYSVLRFILGEIFTDGELLVGDRLESSGWIPNIEFTLRQI